MKAQQPAESLGAGASPASGSVDVGPPAVPVPFQRGPVTGVGTPCAGGVRERPSEASSEDSHWGGQALCWGSEGEAIGGEQWGQWL